MREMAVKKAQAQGQSQQSLKNKPSISFHETYSSGHRSNYSPPVSGPIPLSSSPRTDHNTKALALEIAELEREMENCSNSVRRLQIRKSIASRRADMLRPM